MHEQHLLHLVQQLLIHIKDGDDFLLLISCHEGDVDLFSAIKDLY